MLYLCLYYCMVAPLEFNEMLGEKPKTNMLPAILHKSTKQHPTK